MPNRLQHETSPYLLQHADNPVNWYPWGDEAFEAAKEQDKPILLSIGYSACHWCHVMEHESFEDADTAAFMNEHFISIKVDREERPDVDDIYMQATLLFNRGRRRLADDRLPDAGRAPLPRRDVLPEGAALRHAELPAGHGGGDRDLPHEARAGRADGALGLRRSQPQHVRVAGRRAGHAHPGAARHRRAEYAQSGRSGAWRPDARAAQVPEPDHARFSAALPRRDPQRPALQVALLALRKMAQGGIYDQFGGGFHRYSVDEKWLVPHFEKMLYDNALLARVYLHGWQISGDPFLREIVEDTLDYVLREMTSPEGGFYSTQDADSEGEEGKFFVWTEAELRQALDGVVSNVKAVLDYWGVTPPGNFEGKNILHVADMMERVAVRARPADRADARGGRRRQDGAVHAAQKPRPAGA